MSPREALKTLDNIAANFQGNRTDHLTISAAVAVLDHLVTDVEVKAREVGKKVEDAAKKVVKATEDKQTEPGLPESTGGKAKK